MSLNQGSLQHTDKNDTGSSSFNFELEYDVSHRSVRDILQHILRDWSSQKQLHSWDEKIYATPLKAVRIACQELFKRDNGTYSCDLVLSEAAAEEVLTLKGANQKRPHIQEAAEDVGGHLFFSKVPLKAESQATVFTPDSSDESTNLVNFAQGRIIYTKDHSMESDRAALLVLHTFCLRLQGEVDTFIRQFVGRHLSLRAVFKKPDHFQVTSPLVDINPLQMIYRRVTLSCHLPYLMLTEGVPGSSQDSPFDRTILGIFAPSEKNDTGHRMNLTKSSFSVLLTLTIPEKSSKNEEEMDLLRNPCALWTVLVINGSSQQGPVSDILHNLTPIAQYLRGITVALSVQHAHGRSIYEALKDHVTARPDDSLFDDEHFTKSKLYHWAIKTCHELHESIVSNLRFILRLRESQTNDLCQEAHVHESLGIKYWTQKLEEQIYALEELAALVEALKEKIRESRDALHGVTAVLEARIALQQGNHTQTLTYLATAYLPLTTVASLYSMNVLPSSATLSSFFVVFLIFLLITLLFGVNLHKILSTLQNYWPQRKNYRKLVKSYMQWQMHTPTFVKEVRRQMQIPILLEEEELGYFRTRTRFLILREMALPLEILHNFRLRNNTFVRYEWRFSLFIEHVFRLFLLPLWTVLFVLLLCYYTLKTLWVVFYDSLGGLTGGNG